jgi:hypothetical protein
VEEWSLLERERERETKSRREAGNEKRRQVHTQRERERERCYRIGKRDTVVGRFGQGCRQGEPGLYSQIKKAGAHRFIDTAAIITGRARAGKKRRRCRSSLPRPSVGRSVGRSVGWSIDRSVGRSVGLASAEDAKPVRHL